MESTSSSRQHIYGTELKKKLFKGLDSLLQVPEVVLKAQSVMLDPNSSFDDLASILESDPDITQKILNMANSAYYGLKNKVCSVRQACVMLGLSVISEIIMAAGTSNLLSKALQAYNMTPKVLWQHSLAVALSSRKIADAVSPAVSNEAFLSGLFHDVGKVILHEQIFGRNDSFNKFFGDDRTSHFEVEKQILGFDHSDIASELSRRWKFPQEVTKAIRRHHAVTADQDDELTFILRAADNLTQINQNGDGNEGLPHSIDDQMMDLLSMDENDLTHIMAEVNASVNQMSTEIFKAA